MRPVPRAAAHVLALVIPWLAAGGCKSMSAEHVRDDLLALAGSGLPGGWQLTIETTPGAMGSPHGLEEPLGRMDFVDPTHQLQIPGPPARSAPPSLKLYAYPIAEKDRITKVIDAEALHSWCIPTYYAETDRYLFVGSPCYVNEGTFTPEAEQLLAPLDAWLKQRLQRGAAGK